MNFEGKNIKLVLSGGGTRGIYQVGVLRALEEYGILPYVSSISGCSIGSINAAFLLQYTTEEIKDIWMRFSRYPIFKNVDHYSKLYPLQLLKETIINRGLETDTLKRILYSSLDEDVIRATDLEFVFSTYNYSKKTADYFSLNSVPKDELVPHLIASARLPIFKPEVINGDIYLDGGFVDNEPLYSELEDPVFDLLIRVRTVHITSYIQSLRISNISYKKDLLIFPSGKIGLPLNFKKPSFEERYEMGYRDGLQALRRLREMY